MKIKQIVWRLLVVLTLAGVLAGCTTPTTAPTVAPSAAPTSAPTVAATAVPPTQAPTVDLQPTFNAIKTQSAATVVANLTQNAPAATTAPTAAAATATKAPALTATLAATNTPAQAATATLKPNLTPWTLVPTKAAYSCGTLELSPSKTTAYPTSSSFDVTWVVQNTGNTRWLATETQFWFVDGTKMQKYGDFIPLKTDVAPGGTYTLGIDMLAPATAGTYHIDWKLKYGSVTICSMSMNILIQ